MLDTICNEVRAYNATMYAFRMIVPSGICRVNRFIKKYFKTDLYTVYTSAKVHQNRANKPFRPFKHWSSSRVLI